MGENENLTITLPPDMAARIRAAVEAGTYASPSDVVREALREWTPRLPSNPQELASLRADIDDGLADATAGRVTGFNAGRIADLGRALPRTRSRSG